MKSWILVAGGAAMGAAVAGFLVAGAANSDTGDARVAALEARIASLEAQVSVTGAKRVTVTAADELNLVSGKAKIRMRKSGEIDISGTRVNVDGDSNVVVRGSKIGGN